MVYLIVVRPFASYRIGDVVRDDAAIETILGSDHSLHVVRILPPIEE